MSQDGDDEIYYGGEEVKNLNSKTSFFQYMTSFSLKEKSQLLNLLNMVVYQLYLY